MPWRRLDRRIAQQVKRNRAGRGGRFTKADKRFVKKSGASARAMRRMARIERKVHTRGWPLGLLLGAERAARRRAEEADEA